jgi:penicillin-binding protein 1A
MIRDVLSGPAVRSGIGRARDAGTRVRIRIEPILGRIDPRHVKVAGLVVGLASLALVADIVLGSPGAREIRTLAHMPVATVVLDHQDKPAFTIFEERRYEVPLDRLSPHLVDAVLAIEDQRFRRHAGLDLWRIAGSAWANLRSTSLEQGGSTITQQLAKLSFLTPDKTLRRKLKEIYLAVRIEMAYTKDEILEIYLNKVYFGDGFYGAEAAARGYFAKHAADLSIEEAALLAGLIQRPSAYAPGRHLDRAVARRAVVLEQMAGAKMIDPQTARALAGTPVKLTNGFKHEQVGAYFKQAVTRELVERFGWERVARGGLRIFSTFDPVAQAAAEKSLTEGIAAIERRKSFRHATADEVGRPDGNDSPDYLQGALVALDPSSGAIRALVGGRNFSESQFDRTTQARRQSGSAFKPFVYAVALEQGYSPATLVTGLDNPIATPSGPWLPDDGHETEVDAMTIRTALRTSSNRAAAQLLQTVGVGKAVAYAGEMGLEAPAVPSLVLGTGDVTLLSLTTAYGAFANGGLLQRPLVIRRVEDADGMLLYGTQQESRRVVSEQTAYQMTAMLADVVDRGTGWQARNVGFRLPAAGQTGTTNEYRDAWFVGYTPDLVAGVWIGFDRPRTIVAGGYAGELAVPIWGAFMRDALDGVKGRAFKRPSGLVAVEICQESGLLPGSACHRGRRLTRDGESRDVSTVAVEYFRRGTEPTDECPIHNFSWFGGVRTAAFDPSEFPAGSTVGVLSRPPRRTVDRAADRDRNDDDDGNVGTITSRPEEKPTEKRGFWGRVFGVFKGGDRDDDRGSNNDRNDRDNDREGNTGR